MVDIVAKYQRFAKQLEGAQLRGVTTRVANGAKDILSSGINPAALSGYPAGPVKAKVKVESNERAVLTPTPAGLGALLEKGSGTSWKGGRGRRAYRRSKVPARGAWSKGVGPATAKVPELVHDEVVRALGQVY